jgi:hypothetical protein
MTRITLYTHPFEPRAPQVFEAESAAQWLFDYYGESLTVGVQIFKGDPSAETDISHDAAAILANDCRDYTVLQSPGLPAVIPLWWYVVGAVAVGLLAYALMPSPVMPGNINRSQQSPNNSLGDRSNKVRFLERVEDIYGTVKSIPSLMMPPYIKYINHKKFEHGYYCIGRGFYDVAELRDGDTLISAINGASASVYEPFSSPNSGDAPQLQIGAAIIDSVLTVSRAIEVDGITLKANNQVDYSSAAQNYSFTPDGSEMIITQENKRPNFNAAVAVGDRVTVTMADYPYTVTTWYDAGGLVVPEGDPSAVTSSSTTTPLNYSTTFDVFGVGDGFIRVFRPDVTLPIPFWPATLDINLVSEYSDWVTLPDTDRTEVWVNVTAPNGLFKDNGGKSAATVNFEIEIDQLDATLFPIGIPEIVTGTLTGATSDERADTVEHATAWTGPARVRMRRTTLYDYGFAGTVQDEIKWADLYSVSPVSKADFGNKTTVHTITQATPRATAAKARQLNCIASRKLPIYNGSSFSGTFDASGRLASGAIFSTSRLVDIIAAVSVDPKIGARDLATEVDMAQIWGVQQQLNAWSSQCGQFNYTFDSDNTSFEETVINIANAGFCIAYRQNGKIRLAFDHAQASSSALFTHRNKKPSAETITRKFASDAEYDGVEFVYVDPDSNQSETITLPLSGLYTKLKKFEIPGIRSFAQAWLRASREYAKLLAQRIMLETTTTLDARSLLPNARIDVVDNTRFKSYDGEVVGQSGLELTLSRDVAFAPTLPHSVVLMRRDGTLQSIPATAGSAPNKIILQSLPSEAITTAYGPDGIRTIFSFAADSARGAMAWLVQEIDISDGQYVTLRAINYADSYYAADFAAIPAKAAVIN